MKYQWKKQAESQLRKNVAYCTKKFGKFIALHFIDIIEHQVNLLASHPHLGAIEPLLKDRQRSYRSLVVHKHFKLVYYIDEKKETLYIIALWDTRREPATLTRNIRSK